MLTTNQVPFIAQVSVILYSRLRKCQVFVVPRVCSTQILINHLTSQGLRVSKITNIKHVSIKH